MVKSTISPTTDQARRSRRIAGLPADNMALPSAPEHRPHSSRSGKAKRKIPKNSNNHGTHEEAAALKKNQRQQRQKEPQQECCCICTDQPGRCKAATIDCCHHVFCFDCIVTWSKTENSCPLCKKIFQTISRVHPTRSCSVVTTTTTTTDLPAGVNTLSVPERRQRNVDDTSSFTSARIVIWGPEEEIEEEDVDDNVEEGDNNINSSSDNVRSSRQQPQRRRRQQQPRQQQEWVYHIPHMPVLSNAEERGAFLHHIFNEALGGLNEPITVDVYATDEAPRRRARRRQSSRGGGHGRGGAGGDPRRFQVWISTNTTAVNNHAAAAAAEHGEQATNGSEEATE